MVSAPFDGELFLVVRMEAGVDMEAALLGGDADVILVGNCPFGDV